VGAVSYEGDGDLNGLALCAGVGGLERGIESVLPQYRTICYVEGETYPAAVLASKMEAGQIPKAPIWSNVRTFDGKPWRGKVSFISGGFPCQPYSSAGKQRAEKDPRDLWPDFARIIGEVRPKIIFLENVPGVVKWALPTVLGNLSEMGYDAAWCVVAASQVGAPHKRSRWFLLAHSNDSNEYAMRFNEPQSSPQEFEGNDMAHSNGERRNEVEFNLWGGKSNVERGSRSKEVCYSNGFRLKRSSNEEGCQGVFEKWEMEGDKSQNISPIIADDNGQRLKTKRDICIAKNEKKPRVGVSDWWEVEPGMGRMADGVAHWVHRMRACGNGVVPQQAAYAFTILMDRLI
jgi:DNA (cytosine-5)-methyltransferase 1